MNELGLAIGELDTPFLWVDLDQLEANIASLAAYSGPRAWPGGPTPRA